MVFRDHLNPYPADHDYIVVFSLFYLSLKSLIMGVCVFKHRDLQKIDLKLKNMTNFQPLEVVDRGMNE